MRNLTALLLLLAMATVLHASKVPFIHGSINKAKETAGAEGKLYFVDFYANWCAPCKLMDETTFEDPSVVNYIKKFYVPVKVDVEDFDGFAYKQQYNIKVLPTTLVFNSRGQLLDRIETSLSPTQMLALLKKHNKSFNRKIVIKKKPKPTPPRAPVVHTPPAPKKTTKAKKTKKAKPAGTGLFRFDVEREKASGYSVQVGVFADYANVLVQAEKFKAQYKQPVLVHITTLGDRIVYRVMLGRFGSQKSASKFLKKIKASGQDGVIKTLSELE